MMLSHAAFALASLLLLLLVAGVSSNAASQGQQLLLNGTGLYPRAVNTVDGTVIVSVVTFDSSGDGIGLFLASKDSGKTFSVLSNVTDPVGKTGLCCATLFVLPVAIGQLPAGTLLWAASFGQQTHTMSIRAWASVDFGASWKFLATITSTTTALGLWEPEFAVDVTGTQLVCFFSDETQAPAHSQVLARSLSKDGVHWSPKVNVVAAENPLLRPGMANVRWVAPCTAHSRTVQQWPAVVCACVTGAWT